MSDHELDLRTCIQDVLIGAIDVGQCPHWLKEGACTLENIEEAYFKMYPDRQINIKDALAEQVNKGFLSFFEGSTRDFYRILPPGCQKEAVRVLSFKESVLKALAKLDDFCFVLLQDKDLNQEAAYKTLQNIVSIYNKSSGDQVRLTPPDTQVWAYKLPKENPL